MTCTIKYARPHGAQERWEEIARCLEPAVQHSNGKFTIDDIKQLVLRGHFHVLVVEDEGGEIIAALTASVLRFPREKALEVGFLGGTRGLEWGRDMLAVVENMAQIAGCSRLQFRGRKEWGTVLRQDGYKAVSTLYEKAIGPWVTPPSIN